MVDRQVDMVVVTKGGPKSVYLAIVDSCGLLIKKNRAIYLC